MRRAMVGRPRFLSTCLLEPLEGTMPERFKIFKLRAWFQVPH
jgi:hypothetical protein